MNSEAASLAVQSSTAVSTASITSPRLSARTMGATAAAMRSGVISGTGGGVAVISVATGASAVTRNTSTARRCMTEAMPTCALVAAICAATRSNSGPSDSDRTNSVSARYCCPLRPSTSRIAARGTAARLPAVLPKNWLDSAMWRSSTRATCDR